jgi:hypothetical protein
MKTNAIKSKNKLPEISKIKASVSANTNINKLLKRVILVLLGLAVASSFVSYTLVLCKENDILSLHKKTVEVQMENNDIKTEVEFARSLYTVQNKVSTLNFLHKPDKIIEIEEGYKASNVEVTEFPRIVDERVISGY